MKCGGVDKYHGEPLANSQNINHVTVHVKKTTSQLFNYVQPLTRKNDANSASFCQKPPVFSAIFLTLQSDQVGLLKKWQLSCG